jgi:class 3 adenylate cyclase/tetratricopeptide (TPR) repeat protein
VAARPEVRKTVTVVFSDVSGSTALGERLDPEPLRRVMGRYFDAMSAVVERHGGTVEKFIGDAIMAVFGIPQLHEDDALRAVRAAAEMRERLAELNEELERDFGVRIENRTGVNTGEVVAGDPSAGQRLVTGDAVNTAARLEQAADPGHVLLGEPTYRLVSTAVEVEGVDPVAAKGKADRVSAYRLLRIREGAEPVARRFESPLVGRGRELELLAQAYRRAVDERTCHLFTLLGTAGIGKSRLTQEFLASVSDGAMTLSGRCLAYGEGITYWPLVEILEQLGSGESIVQLLEGEPGARPIVNRVLGAVGLADDAGSPEETPWAVRKLFEALAREQPLVLVFDDLHWGEPTFLDLVEHVADWSRDAPILLLCLARPELLDDRSGWGGGKLNATTILLEPLGPDEAETLIDNLLAGSALPETTRARIAEAAEGNPLFVEQMLAMLSEDGAADSDVAIPPTIQALLAARLDRLEAPERDAIERASVVGKEFWHRAVVELAVDRAAVVPALRGLVRKELIRPHRSVVFPRDDAFQFRHLLIRDAAYAALPKELRAELHERLASWLETARSEFDEIVAYHLEQAYRYRTELGPLGDSDAELAARAGAKLATAGARALRRGNDRDALNLLERAIELLPPGRARVEAQIALAEAAAYAGELARGEAVAEEAASSAVALADEWLGARATLQRLANGVFLDPHRYWGAIEPFLSEAIPLFERRQDQSSLARSWSLRAWIPYVRSRAAETEAALERAVEHAREAGDRREESRNLIYLVEHASYGEIPFEDGVKRADQIFERARGMRYAELGALEHRGYAQIWLGQFDAARDSFYRGEALASELGLADEVDLVSVFRATFELEAPEGDLARAVDATRNASERLLRGEATFDLFFVGPIVARVLLVAGKHDEAANVVTALREKAPGFYLRAQVAWRSLEARLLAPREPEASVRLAREAVDLADESDWLNMQADARLDLAEVLRETGESVAEPLTEALRLYERKGNVVRAEKVRSLLAEHAPA